LTRINSKYGYHLAIVSASGFSEPAIRKALKHGLRLLELEEWDPRDDVFPAGMTHWNTFRERMVVWDGPQVSFNPNEASSSELQSALEANAALVDEFGTLYSRTPRTSCHLLT
jgi:hypothetical protein